MKVNVGKQSTGAPNTNQRARRRNQEETGEEFADSAPPSELGEHEQQQADDHESGDIVDEETDEISLEELIEDLAEAKLDEDEGEGESKNEQEDQPNATLVEPIDEQQIGRAHV